MSGGGGAEAASASAGAGAPPAASTASTAAATAEAQYVGALRQLSELRFSPKLVAAIASVTQGGGDALDSPDFSAVEYINTIFPNEQSLKTIDKTIAKMEVKISRLDEDILVSVREQSSSDRRGKKELESAKSSIVDLYAKMNDIKKKAEASEDMAQKICSQIRTLDYGKRNLTKAIRTLKKLQMLVSSSGKLKDLLRRKQYKEAAEQLSAVQLLLAEFSRWATTNRQVVQLTDQVNRLQADAYNLAHDQYAAYFEHKIDSTQLLDVCAMVDALDEAKRKEFLHWICENQLTEYRTLFNPQAECAKLEHVGKRYEWLMKHLEENAPLYNEVFPPDWNVFELLADQFCVDTKLDLMNILQVNKDLLVIKVLVDALKKTLSFERQLREDFRTDPAPTQQRQQQRDIHTPKPELDEQEAAAAGGVIVPVKFKGTIAGCFDPYLELYTRQEEHNISKVLSDSLAEETWIVTEEENEHKVLTSGTDFVYYLKTSFTRCVELSQDQPLYDLNQVFKRQIRTYAAALSSKLPQENAKIGEQDIRLCCAIINTGDYCCQRTEQLGELFAKHIHTKFREKVDMTAEVNEIKASCVQSLRVMAPIAQLVER
eukprot:TRINITY_DN1155_c0_g1_i2.p1 TRINITY_DN1155_c0_g1~~TRINITY_DN1155_c0_g1_i2.p1  ORF type:complete len:609 (-),score=193.54 TRINITY_DN1155_c0_g1_i2:1075-2877(-)